MEEKEKKESEVIYLCLTRSDPMDCSPPGSSIHGILYWSGVPSPSPGDLTHPGIKPGSPTLQAEALPSEPPGKLCGGEGPINIHEELFVCLF